jgi:nicotinamidase-related amidase
MSDFNCDASRTGLLLVDPYNDFLSDGGKLWPMVKGVANEVGLLDNLRSILAAARAASIQVFFVPHRRWEPGDYEAGGITAGRASHGCRCSVLGEKRCRSRSYRKERRKGYGT